MKYLLVVLALLFFGGAAQAQDALVVANCGTNPQTYTPGATRLLTVDQNGKLCGSGGGVTPSGTFTAGDLIAGAGTTSAQDSANCTTYCALPNRFQVGSATSATSLWPDTVIPGTSTASQLYVITATPVLAGYIAGAFNTRTSDAPADTGGVTEGTQTLCLNDRTTGVRNAWCNYTQAMFTTTLAGGQLFGHEYSISNVNPASTTLATSEDPFHINVNKWDHGIRVDCIQASNFGQSTSFTCKNGMDFVPNPLPFTTGINFANGALDTTVLTNPPALLLPSGTNGYSIAFYSAAATPEWNIWSVASGGSGTARQLRFGTSVVDMIDPSGTIDFEIAPTTGGTTKIGSSSGVNCGNYIQVNGAANGAIPQIQALGCSDANTTLQLAGKTNLGGVRISGHLLTRNLTAAPTVTTCGTGTINAASTDNSGLVTATGATACTVTFNVAYTSAPFCWATDATTAVALKVTSATTGLTISGLTLADQFFYGCMGQAGT